ncbi:Uncharacterised protein [Serratia quinivorans]|uniref:Phage stabilisation protein n=1 Tax=Serratia quinivorans TaxID=137545 RepID=A0A380AUU0_9GAMM|nr:hypothetical protein [Serratia proteamaculans]RYM60185.1 hypothetical protein BSR03_17225 [Serratia proteamaculans]SUI88290.1 Uncharacterised protein [Serratia quinivorans]
MTSPAITKLGAVGLALDGDDTLLPDNAFTDVNNVRFDAREIVPYLGTEPEPYYATSIDGVVHQTEAYRMQPIIFDGFSNGSSLLYLLGRSSASVAIFQQNMGEPDLKVLTVTDFSMDNTWLFYKGQINNCPFFGRQGHAPIGKQYDWVAFDSLPGWGEQTGGDQVVVTRRWTCSNLVSFDNRLLALNTTEETAGGVDIPYPNRIRWSGFAQENALPINWDDTAGNRTPEEYAAAVIDGFAGWQDLSSGSQIIDACENGGTLYVYTARETFSLTPSGNDQAPFVTKLLYSDMGCVDIGCCVNAHGYNYVFTGADVIRHDSVSRKSIAEGRVREYLAELANEHKAGMVRLAVFPELSEVWVMCYGRDQDDGDYAKTYALTYNYINQTWGKKSLPYIYDTDFLPAPPDDPEMVWDNDAVAWDSETQKWNRSVERVAQGNMCGSCKKGGIYYLNKGYSEWSHDYVNGEWRMQKTPLSCYVERRGLEFGAGGRYMVTEAYLNGRGTNAVTLAIGRANHPGSGYTWSEQNVNLTYWRRSTWRAEGGMHAYRMTITGEGNLPSAITFKVRSTGR